VQLLKHWLSPGKAIPALMMLFGVLLLQGGFFAVMSGNTLILTTTTLGTVTEYSGFHVGLLIGLHGVVIAAVGYLLFYGRIKFS